MSLPNINNLKDLVDKTRLTIYDTLIKETYLSNLTINGIDIQYTYGDKSIKSLTLPIFKGATSTANGTSGLIPTPAKGKQDSYLRGDGTWATPTNTNTTYALESMMGNTKLVPSTGDPIITQNNIYYAECTTARNVVDKVVNCDGFVLEQGALIAIRFTDMGTSNATSGNLTLNINNTGAKNIVPKAHNNILNYNWSSACYNNQTWIFIYNGTYFVMLNQDNNTTYTPMSLGFGYGTCATAEATVDKVVSLTGYVLLKNGMVSVKFTYAVPANATLNINGKGAKNIFYRGTKITAGIIVAGDIATFVFDGTQYHLIAIDSRNANTVNGHTVESNVPANAVFTDTVYTLPTAGSSLGGVKTTSTVTSTTGLTPCPIISGIPYYKDTNNTYNIMTGSTTSTAGKSGLVPAPSTGSQDKFLRGDGTWAEITVSVSDATTLNGKSASDFALATHVQAYTSSECTTYEADDSSLGVTPAAVKKAFGIFTAANANTVNGHTVESNVPANAVFTDTTYDLSPYLLTSNLSSTLAGMNVCANTFTATYADGLRIAFGTYGFFIRNDGSNTYFMLTNSGDPFGSWNSLRPISILNSTGGVYIGNGLSVAGGLSVNSGGLVVANGAGANISGWLVSHAGRSNTARTDYTTYQWRNTAASTSATPASDATYGSSGSIYLQYS